MVKKMKETELFKQIWNDLKDLNIGEDNMTIMSCCILKEMGKTQRTETIKEGRHKEQVRQVEEERSQLYIYHSPVRRQAVRKAVKPIKQTQNTFH